MFSYIMQILPAFAREFLRKFFAEDLEGVHVMVDLETLGTRPGCKVLQIGAVVATPRGITGEFLVNISLSDQELYGLTASESTMNWWAKQDQAVRKKVFDQTNRRSLSEALSDFERFLRVHSAPPFGELTQPKVLVYGNGAGFDQPILTALYDAVGRAPGWKFYNERCYRTLKNLYPEVPFVKPTMAHDALADARAQAEHLIRMLNRSEHGWR